MEETKEGTVEISGEVKIPEKPDTANGAMLTIPQDDAAKAMQEAGFEAQPGSYFERMMQIAKSHNGWNYVSVSRIERYDNKNQNTLGVTSALVRAIIRNYTFDAIMHNQKPDVATFLKTFVGQPVIYVQVHKGMPTMAKDGCYDAVDINGKTIESKAVTEFLLTEEANKHFEPFILVKSNGQIGVLKGNPYYQFSQDDINALRKMTQGDQPSAEPDTPKAEEPAKQA